MEYAGDLSTWRGKRGRRRENSHHSRNVGAGCPKSSTGAGPERSSSIWLLGNSYFPICFPELEAP